MAQTNKPDGTGWKSPLYIELPNGTFQPIFDEFGNLVAPSGQQSTASATTNGTTAVSVFGASGLPTAITITGVYLIALDTTAGNITVEAPASTVVATIAKGTTAGALVGAASLTNTAVPAGTDVVVDSSSAGNAQVFITYIVA